MIASVPFVQKTFDYFNAQCFNGVLPAVPIVLTKAGTFLGKMEYKSSRDIFGIISSHYDFRLKISTGFFPSTTRYRKWSGMAALIHSSTASPEQIRQKYTRLLKRSSPNTYENPFL